MGRRREQHMDTIRTFLAAESTLVLSTFSWEGEPRATPLFYLAEPDLSLFWVSSCRSRHSLHLAQHPQASVAIFHATEEWKKIIGVQMQGAVERVRGPERESILQAYCTRFRLGSLVSAAARRSALYCFRPRWIRYISNARRLGYRFEIEMGGG